jgi:hypothetical protein
MTRLKEVPVTVSWDWSTNMVKPVKEKPTCMELEPLQHAFSSLMHSITMFGPLSIFEHRYHNVSHNT